MATKEMTLLKVDKVGPYGIQSNGQWYGISKFGNAKLESLKEGNSYEVLLSFSKEGKPYISNIEDNKGKDTMIPKTKVERTKPSDGDSPVAKAGTYAATDEGTPKGQVLKDLVIVAQNVEAAFQTSQEWANMSMGCVSDEDREKLWKANVKWRFDYVLDLARGK